MVSERHRLFRKRLTELGMFDKDSDYDGMIGEAIMELSETFSNQGHSGMSALLTISLFTQLMGEYNSPHSPMWKSEE